MKNLNEDDIKRIEKEINEKNKNKNKINFQKESQKNNDNKENIKIEEKRDEIKNVEKDVLTEKNNIIKKIVLPILLIIAFIAVFYFLTKDKTKDNIIEEKNNIALSKKKDVEKIEFNEENNKIFLSALENSFKQNNASSETNFSTEILLKNKKIANIDMNISLREDLKNNNKQIKITNGLFSIKPSMIPLTGEFSGDMIVVDNFVYVKIDNFSTIFPMNNDFIGKWFKLDNAEDFKILKKENFKDVILEFNKKYPLLNLKKKKDNIFNLSLNSKNLEKFIITSLNNLSDEDLKNFDISKEDLVQTKNEVLRLISVLASSVKENKSFVEIKNNLLTKNEINVSGEINLSELNNISEKNIKNIDETFEYKILASRKNTYNNKDINIKKPENFKILSDYLAEKNPDILRP